MPSGFQAFGDSGQIQVDENYRNMALINRVNIQTVSGASIGINPNWQSWYLGWQYYTARSADSLLAFRCAAYCEIMQAQLNSDGTVTYLLATWTVSNGNAGGWNGTVEIYEFGPPPTNAGSGSGIQVFNASGQLCFSSDFKYLKVARYQSDNTQGNNQGEFVGNPMTINSARSYAIALTPGLCHIDSYQDLPGQFQNTIYAYGASTNVQGGYRTVGSIIYQYSGGSGAAGVGFYLYTMLVIDVTGY